MRGRPPIPANLRRLEASARTLRRDASKRRTRHNKTTGRPACPPSLKGDRAALWRSLAALVEQLGALTPADGVALELLTVALDRWRRLSAAVDAHGDTITYTTASGNVRQAVNPEATALVAVQRQVVELCDRLGLSPTARARLAIEQPAEEIDFARPRYDESPPEPSPDEPEVVGDVARESDEPEPAEADDELAVLEPLLF